MTHSHTYLIVYLLLLISVMIDMIYSFGGCNIPGYSNTYQLTAPRRYFFCGSFVLVMLLRLLVAALWSTEGKGLTSWLLFVMFIVSLLLSHLVSWTGVVLDCIDS